MSTTISKPRKAPSKKTKKQPSVPTQDSSCRFVLATGLSIPALLRKYMAEYAATGLPPRGLVFVM